MPITKKLADNRPLGLRIQAQEIGLDEDTPESHKKALGVHYKRTQPGPWALIKFGDFQFLLPGNSATEAGRERLHERARAIFRREYPDAEGYIPPVIEKTFPLTLEDEAENSNYAEVEASADHEYGTVLRFQDQKGFGEILADTGEKFFVHWSSIDSNHPPVLYQNQRVQFTRGEYDGKTVATQVIWGI